VKDDFLLEIGAEEMPAKLMPGLVADLERRAREALEASRLSYDDLRVWGTPRRLALIVDGVAERQRDEEVELKGPSERVAYGEAGQAGGRLTKAGEGFARGQGLDPGRLFIKDTPGGPYVFARRVNVGRPAAEVLAEMAVALVTGLEVERPMRWGASDFRFVRPIRWLVAIYGDEALPVEIAGVKAGRSTRGHRFLAPDETPTVFRASAYRDVLERVGVLVDQTERRRVIAEGASREAARRGGWPVLDDDLLDEITYRVEWPTALAGSFSREFLDLPAPVLTTTMRHHQRYIPVAEAQEGTLLPVFVVIRNGGEDGLDLVREGNERVLTARLSDARFFWTEDRKRPLVDRVEDLNGILFLENFGTLRDKTDRIIRLSGAIWEDLGLPPEGAAKVARAARLAKADLGTMMVRELTDLQGVMGREYALASGEDPDVAEAISEHYLPRRSGDKLPSTHLGRVVSVADKLDTIVGCFLAGIEPTGSFDPHGLRRQAAGVVATAVDAGYLLPLAGFIPQVAEPFAFVSAAGIESDAGAADVAAGTAGAAGGSPVSARAGKRGPVWDGPRLTAAVLTFFVPRVRALLEEEGVAYDVIDASLAGWGSLGDVGRVVARARALKAFKATGAFADLTASYVRVTGLAGKAAAGGVVRSNLFSEDPEFELHQACVSTRERVETILAAAEERARRMAVGGHGADALGVLGDAYQKVLGELSNLRPVVDRFFDAVLVMAQDETIRENRLALLTAVAELMGSAGDLSKLVIEGT
jgi:glycyl-tRNA synthetase beta chain